MSEKRDERAKELRERLNNELQRMSLDMCVKCTICETACPVAAVFKPLKLKSRLSLSR